MKKQLLAAAIAAAVAAPIAASADVTVYGQLHYSIDSIDFADDTNTSWALQGMGVDGTLNDGYDGTAVNSHNSRFGIKGSEDLGSGLSLLFQMEFTISGDDLGGVNNDRNTYVALAGSWGVLGIGQVDSPLKSSTASLDLFAERVGDYEQLGFNDIRLPDTVFYMSPNWNGFSLVGGVVLPSLTNDIDGIEAVSIAATYNNGPWFASLAYEEVSDDLISLIDGTTAGDYDKWRLGLGYTANGFHVNFIYEDRDFEEQGDGYNWQLSGSYTAGNNTFKMAYGRGDDLAMTGIRGSEWYYDTEQWSVGVDHKLSNRTTVYAAYTDHDEDADSIGLDYDYDVFSLGIIHKF